MFLRNIYIYTYMYETLFFLLNTYVYELRVMLCFACSRTTQKQVWLTARSRHSSAQHPLHLSDERINGMKTHYVKYDFQGAATVHL